MSENNQKFQKITEIFDLNVREKILYVYIAKLEIL